MSSELRTTWPTGEEVKACIFRKSDGKVWYPVGVVWETWGTGSRTVTDYLATELDEVAAGSGYYVGDFPTAITTEGDYDVQLRVTGITDPVGILEITWSGTAAAAEAVVPATTTAICNRSIAMVGGGGQGLDSFRISSIHDTSDSTAALCLMLYPQVKKEVLVRAWWSEATKYADLGGETDVTRADWEYAFPLPADYLGKCEQIDEVFHRSTKPRLLAHYDHEIIQGRLFTNWYTNSAGDSAYIRYIFDLTNPAKFSPLLRRSISTLLAAELSPVLLKEDGSKRRYFLIEEYERIILPLAEGENAMQNGDDEDQGEYTAITVRTT